MHVSDPVRADLEMYHCYILLYPERQHTLVWISTGSVQSVKHGAEDEAIRFCFREQQAGEGGQVEGDEGHLEQPNRPVARWYLQGLRQ